MKSLKKVISGLVAIAKAKAAAVKSKADTIKTRIMIFRLLHNKTLLMNAISHKIHAVKGDEKVKGDNNAVVPYKLTPTKLSECVEEEDCTELTNSLLQLELDDKDADLEDGAGSLTCSEFSLANEVDKAADIFIRRFHRQMMIQKQESFKRYEEMLEKSV